MFCKLQQGMALNSFKTLLVIYFDYWQTAAYFIIKFVLGSHSKERRKDLQVGSHVF